MKVVLRVRDLRSEFCRIVPMQTADCSKCEKCVRKILLNVFNNIPSIVVVVRTKTIKMWHRPL